MITLLCTRTPSQDSSQIYRDYGIKVLAYDFKKKRKGGKISAFIDYFGQVQPDVFWFLKDFWLTPRTLKLLRDASPKTKFIMWYGDQRGKVPELISERSKFIDMLFINNADPHQTKMYKKVGINYVKPYYSFYYPTTFDSKVKPDSEIVFGGNNFRAGKFPLSAFRLKVIMAINKRFNLKLYGNGWPIPAEPFIKDRIRYNRALYRSKMTLGLNHYELVRYYDRRMFDCLSVGKLHITHYIPKMELDFENHKHLVWFKTVPECLKLIKYYTVHTKERERIGRAGRSKLLKSHSVNARIKQFVQNLAAMQVTP